MHVQCPDTLLSWAEKRIEEQWTLKKHEEQQDIVCDTVIVGQKREGTEPGEGRAVETDRKNEGS